MPRRYIPDELNAAGLTTWGALALACGVSESAISQVRRGVYPLSPRMRSRIASALNVPESLVDVVLASTEPQS